MLSTTRSRVRALAIVAMAGVAVSITAVTFHASAAETPAPAAPAAVGPDARAVSIPIIPKSIKPPAGSRPIGAYLVAAGTQNYTCVVPAEAKYGAYTGTSTPEAQLIGTGGRVHHFGGPSWQSVRDRSLVTAIRVDGVTRDGTIPELLLEVASHTGSGIMTNARYINRLHTSGGLAPTDSCSEGQVAKVPYGAIYVFWAKP